MRNELLSAPQGIDPLGKVQHNEEARIRLVRARPGSAQRRYYMLAMDNLDLARHKVKSAADQTYKAFAEAKITTTSVLCLWDSTLLARVEREL